MATHVRRTPLRSKNSVRVRFTFKAKKDRRLGRSEAQTRQKETWPINPRGNATATRYQRLQAIVCPVGAYIDIARDPHGKPTAITRRNSTGTADLTCSYTDNANRELCRQVEPETGATLMGYDGDGNLACGRPGGQHRLPCHQQHLDNPGAAALDRVGVPPSCQTPHDRTIVLFSDSCPP